MSTEIAFLLFTLGLSIIFNKLIIRAPLWVNLIFNVPGTIAHEACHAIIGIITRAGVTKISLIPKIDGNSIIYGYVSFNNLSGFSAFPSAMAPLLLYAFPLLVVNIIESGLTQYELVFWIALSVMVCHSAFPSRKDFKIALSYPLGSLIWIGIIGYGLYSKYEYQMNSAIYFLMRVYYDYISPYIGEI